VSAEVATPAKPVATGKPIVPPDAFRRFTAVVAAAVPLAIISIVVLLAQQGWPAIQHFGLSFLVGQHWDPVKSSFGALPVIYGTVVSSFLALAIAIPVGVAVAVFLAEPGLTRLRGVIGTGVEMLAAIPSVVYGLWGLYVMAPWVFRHIDVPIVDRLGWIGPLQGPARQQSLFAAALVLAVMVLPTLASISRDVVRSVPSGMREASFALGATWWETTWQVVLPAARAGIFGATILALGRALGETIAVTMVIGNRPEIAPLFSPSYTLASQIANEFTEATGVLYSSALIELGLVLVLVTLTINVFAQLLVASVIER
jgi:phosphate transport system permease protein